MLLLTPLMTMTSFVIIAQDPLTHRSTVITAQDQLARVFPMDEGQLFLCKRKVFFSFSVPEFKFKIQNKIFYLLSVPVIKD
jgi:hypothetical protein